MHKFYSKGNSHLYTVYHKKTGTTFRKIINTKIVEKRDRMVDRCISLQT